MTVGCTVAVAFNVDGRPDMMSNLGGNVSLRCNSLGEK